MPKNAKERQCMDQRLAKQVYDLGKRSKIAKIQGLGPDPKKGPSGPCSGPWP